MGDYLEDDEGYVDYLIGMENTPGFGQCGRCQYVRAGSPTICATCAGKSLATPEHACSTCGQRVSAAGDVCPNAMCASPSRAFDRVYAIALKSGALERAILAYKDQGKWGWGIIFGRVLLGFLREHPHLTASWDHIIPMPAYQGPDHERRTDDLAAWTIENAMLEDTDGLPFLLEPPLIVKTAVTGKMRTTAGKPERMKLMCDLRAALTVPSAARVRGARICVFDDVFTGGHTLQTVASVLRGSGARSVSGIVLARQPWRTSGAR